MNATLSAKIIFDPLIVKLDKVCYEDVSGAVGIIDSRIVLTGADLPLRNTT